MKRVSSVSVGEPQVGLIQARVAIAYEERDRARMEWLNRKIAETPTRAIKYLYKRTHAMTVPGEMCSICGKRTGVCDGPLDEIVRKGRRARS